MVSGETKKNEASKIKPSIAIWLFPTEMPNLS
ncbi:Uncharacterised protein [Vibrio cholerae]|nr:Uncharacterised protein [Vibrio cholerae]